MALAFYVNGPNDLPRAFAAHDEFMAIFTHVYFRSRKQSDIRALRPDNDNFYSAPYCFMPKNLPVTKNNDSEQQNRGRFSSNSNNKSGSGFLVFTCQVPWLHGNPAWRGGSNNSNSDHPPWNSNNHHLEQQQRAHVQAKEWMEEQGALKAPHIGTVEEFQSATNLNLNEWSVHTFTVDGGYPTAEDISQYLEDKAIVVTCSAMGWAVPENWRAIRKKLSDTHNIPVLNLAEWDEYQCQQHRRRKRIDNDDIDHDAKDTNNNHKNNDDHRGEAFDDDDRFSNRNDDGQSANMVHQNDETTSTAPTSTTTHQTDEDEDGVVKGGKGGGSGAGDSTEGVSGGDKYARCVTVEGG